MAKQLTAMARAPSPASSFAVGVVLGAVVACVVVSRDSGVVFPSRRLLGAAEDCSFEEGTGWASVKRVDRWATLQHLNPDILNHVYVPPKGSGGFAFAGHAGPKGAMLFGRAPFDFGERTLIPSQCDDVDVVVVGEYHDQERCTLVTAADDMAVPRHVARMERATKPIRPGDAFDNTTWRAFTRYRGYNVYDRGGALTNPQYAARGAALFTRLWSRIDDVRRGLAPILEAAAAHTPRGYAMTMGAEAKGAVIVMAVNWSNFDLLLNFLRSACARAIDVRNLVVFAGDAEVERALRDVGVLVFRHEALGDVEGASRGYGDGVFANMMWLKTASVFLVNDLGYDLLFQDADLYWWRAPWDYFARRPDVDTAWMDDGARSVRFMPHFPNSGYFLVRANVRTNFFLQTLALSQGTVFAVGGSQQAVISTVVTEHHAAYGLGVLILPYRPFPSGKHYHHNKALWAKIESGAYEPYCFHMCWTANKADKLKFLAESGLWYLEDGCDLDALAAATPEARRRCALGACAG